MQRTWSYGAPPPMGRFDEAKSAVSESKRFESKRSESKLVDSRASESKLALREHNYKDNSIFVDELESASDDSSDYTQSDEEEEEPEQEMLARDRGNAEADHSEAESIFDTDLEDSDREESDGSESSTLSSDAFVEQDLNHLRRYVGKDVVVCFGEAWLRGTVAKFQANNGSRPTKECGVLVTYEKAESEWLRNIKNDPDVQVLDDEQSWGQKFNAVELGDPVIGLYNANCWCPGVVEQKLPAPEAVDGQKPESPRFGIRFENGQTGQCTCDEIVVVSQTLYKSSPVSGSKKSLASSPVSGASGVYGGSSSEDDRDSSESSSDSNDEEFTGHRRQRLGTPSSKSRPRQSSKTSIEFSWQQHGKAAYRAVDGPPKDSQHEGYAARLSQRGNIAAGNVMENRLARHDHGGSGSGRNLLQSNNLTGSRESLMHDPQKLLALPLEELVEGGFARQVLSDHTRSPRMELERIDKWSHCKCRYEDTAKTKFYMYDELTGELLLTAKRIGSDFYISQYPDFPDIVKASNVKKNVHSACGVLHFCETTRPRTPSTKRASRMRARIGGGIARCQLWSTSCDYCDNALAKYVCGPATASNGGFYAALTSRGHPQQTAAEAELDMLKKLGCRQLLADFTQSNIEIKMGPPNAGRNCETVEARRLTVAVPSLATDERSEQTHHCGWCDRCPRDHGSTLQLASTVPEWNDEVERLTMCFEEGHVREHSSKNFLLHEVADPLSPNKSPKSLQGLKMSPRSPRKSCGKGASPTARKYPGNKRTCLQFGKSSKRLFTLSYRYPMSAMQGFGIALSHFNWLPDQS